MRKTAQGNPFTTPYGQGSLAGYGQGGYDTSMDNLALVPGLEPTQAQSYEAGVSNWKLPAGLAAGGLLASVLLRKGGKGLVAGGKKLQQTAHVPRPGPLTPDQEKHVYMLSKYHPAEVVPTLESYARNVKAPR